MSPQKRLYWLIAIGVVLCVALIITGFLSYNVTHATPQPPPAKAVNCGSLSTHGMNGPSWTQHGTVSQIGNCFWNNYQQCNPAILNVTQMGVDAGTVHALTITGKQGNSCVVSDSYQNYNVNFGNSMKFPITTSTCSSVTREQNVLHFSCGTVDMSFSIADA